MKHEMKYALYFLCVNVGVVLGGLALIHDYFLYLRIEEGHF